MFGLEPLQCERREEFEDLVNGCAWERRGIGQVDALSGAAIT